MKLKIFLTSTISFLLLSGGLSVAVGQAPSTAHEEGVYLVAYRTQNHINRSSPDVFHKVSGDLIAFLKSRNVNIAEDPERGILQTDESFSTESLLNLAKNARASSLLLVTVDRPAIKWLKVTVQAYDMTGKLLWQEEASSGGGFTGGGAPEKVFKTLQTKLEPRVGKPGLPERQPGTGTQPGGSSAQPTTPSD